tara:strand:- start:1066 stop:1500 length:435 start_codon:yes stop_codon:yes gene_type:complete
MIKIFIDLLGISLVATLAMTLFSYALSYLTKSKFEEPQLLNLLVSRHKRLKYLTSREHIIGWALHFGIGLVFVILFYVVHKLFDVSITYSFGAFFGFIAGIAGVLGWQILLYIHPDPPDFNRKLFFIQLIIAHIIFGLTIITIY